MRYFTPLTLFKYMLIITLISSMLLISGCWNTTDYHGRSFVKAVGIDYIDGKFHSYAQFLNFTSIAKSEAGGSIATEPITWVGEGIDTSFFKATTNLYRTTQTYVLWGHITAVILSERAFKAFGGAMLEMVGRYPETRYNTWIYVTKDSIEQILSTNSFFEMSALYSILHNPEPNYKQYSYLPPVTTFQYLSHYKEPAATSYLPAIVVNDDTWKQSKKKLPLLTLNGGYFQVNQKYLGYLTESQLQGYHWMLKSTRRAPLSVSEDGNLIAQLTLNKPRIKVKPVIKDDQVKFHITVKLTGSLFEYIEPVTYEKLVTLAAEQVKKEINHTYNAALKKNIDIYDFSLVLRRSNLDAWNKFSKQGTTPIINKHSIEKLDVHVHIPYFGKFKRRPS